MQAPQRLREVSTISDQSSKSVDVKLLTSRCFLKWLRLAKSSSAGTSRSSHETLAKSCKTNPISDAANRTRRGCSVDERDVRAQELASAWHCRSPSPRRPPERTRLRSVAAPGRLDKIKPRPLEGPQDCLPFKSMLRFLGSRKNSILSPRTRMSRSRSLLPRRPRVRRTRAAAAGRTAPGAASIDR